MNQHRPPVRKGRKYDQVVDGARKVFLKDGFEGASVDDIAREAGVSKATLYSYFPDKRFLFMEVASSQCEVQADRAMHDINMDNPPAEVLPRIGHHFLGFILSDIGQRIFRVCVGEADRFPELGQRFYTSGPEMTRAKLVEYFEKSMARGELQIDDMDLAAFQFGELCKADLWPRLIFGVQKHFSPEEKERVVNGAVEMFLARYGA